MGNSVLPPLWLRTLMLPFAPGARADILLAEQQSASSAYSAIVVDETRRFRPEGFEALAGHGSSWTE